MNNNKKFQYGVVPVGKYLVQSHSAVADDQLLNLGQVKSLLSGSLSKFSIVNAIYDNGGDAASVNGTPTYVVGRYVYAFETVDSFTAGKVYRVTSGGLITAASFEERVLVQGDIIDFVETVVNPNDEEEYFSGGSLYEFQSLTSSLVEIGHTQTKGAIYSSSVTVNFGDTEVSFNQRIPSGATVLEIRTAVVTPFNGTTGALSLGDDADNTLFNPLDGISLQAFSANEVNPVFPVDGLVSDAKNLKAYLATNATAGQMKIDVIFKA